MNADLLTAIQNTWNASTNLTDRFAGGLWVSRAKSKANLPLAVLTLVSNATDYSTCTSRYVENIVIQFTAYASDSDNTVAGDFLVATADDIEAAFNFKTLPTATDYVLNCRKTSGGLPRPEDDKVWRIDVEYEICVQRNVA